MIRATFAGARAFARCPWCFRKHDRVDVGQDRGKGLQAHAKVPRAARAAQKQHGSLDAGVAIDSDAKRLQFVVVGDLARREHRRLPPERTDQRQERDC